MHNDSWQTPDDLFQVLDKGGTYQGVHFDGFHFDIDLAATADNSKCNLYCNDYLQDSYVSKTQRESDGYGIPVNFQGLIKVRHPTCWLNPPYSRELIKPFIQKAWEDSKYCKIVCLVKVDPSTEWWSTFWNYGTKTCDMHHVENEVCPLVVGPKPGCEVIYFPKRIKFDPPQQLIASGDVVKYKNKWLQKCTCFTLPNWCGKCNHQRWKQLSGPAFPSCLLIFDRFSS
tara:strand:+ start:35278 stop:35961 length:684 start_codon:yes stop_codon:yes gene_type:complete